MYTGILNKIILSPQLGTTEYSLLLSNFSPQRIDYYKYEIQVYILIIMYMHKLITRTQE